MVRAFAHHLPNSLQDFLRITQYFIVPKPQDTNLLGLERLSAFRIVSYLGWLSMTSAIQFDGKPEFQTIEIQNVFPHRMLPPEFHASQLPITKQFPHQRFGIGGILAQCTNSRQEFRREG